MFFQVDKIPYVFRQSTNFRYLTGSKSNDSALVLRFNGDIKELHSTLILPVSLQYYFLINWNIIAVGLVRVPLI